MKTNEITERVIGAAIKVHRVLGPGLLESSYERALFYELGRRDLSVQRQVPVSVRYEAADLGFAYTAAAR